jgi:hypothetical protein
MSEKKAHKLKEFRSAPTEIPSTVDTIFYHWIAENESVITLFKDDYVKQVFRCDIKSSGEGIGADSFGKCSFIGPFKAHTAEERKEVLEKFKGYRGSGFEEILDDPTVHTVILTTIQVDDKIFSFIQSLIK